MAIGTKNKNKVERKTAIGLNFRIVTECFTEKVTCEQRPEGDGEGQPRGYLGKVCFVKRKSSVTSEAEVGLVCSERARRCVCLRQ